MGHRDEAGRTVVRRLLGRKECKSSGLAQCQRRTRRLRHFIDHIAVTNTSAKRSLAIVERKSPREKVPPSVRVWSCGRGWGRPDETIRRPFLSGLFSERAPTVEALYVGDPQQFVGRQLVRFHDCSTRRRSPIGIMAKGIRCRSPSGSAPKAMLNKSSASLSRALTPV